MGAPVNLATNRELLVALTREQSRIVSRRIQRYCPMPEDLQQYKSEAEPTREQIARMKVSSLTRVLERAVCSRILYVDDWHTHSMPKAFFETILLSLHFSRRPVVFATELFRASSQGIIDQYLRRELDDEHFKEAIRRRQFCTEGQLKSYLRLFQLARRLNIQVVAIDHQSKTGDLELRDQKIANSIKQVCDKNPDAIVCVLIGGWHLGSTHLPARVEENFSSHGQATPASVVLFQNVEPVYGALAKAGLEQDVEVVSFGGGVYCAITSTPLAQRLSHYRYALEMDEQETSLDDPRHDVTGNVYLSLLCKFLSLEHEIRIRGSDLTNEIVVQALFDLPYDESHRTLLSELKGSRSVVLTRPSLRLCLPTSDADSLVAALGFYARFRMLNNGSRVYSMDPTDLFYDEVLMHSFSHLMARFVDHKRKSNAMKSIVLAYTHGSVICTGFEMSCVRQLRDYLGFEMRALHGKEQDSRLISLRGAARYELVQSIGSILGDGLFDGLMSDSLAISQLRDIMTYDSQKTAARELYFDLRRKFVD